MADKRGKEEPIHLGMTPDDYPDDEDIVTRDVRTWRWYGTGKVAVVTDPERWQEDLSAWAQAEGYWPTAWEYLERDVYFIRPY